MGRGIFVIKNLKPVGVRTLNPQIKLITFWWKVNHFKKRDLMNALRKITGENRITNSRLK